MVLTAADVAKAADAVYEIVAVPEWGGDVRVRTLTALEVGELQSLVEGNSADAKGAFMLRVLAACLVDGDGARLWPDATLGVQALAGRNGQVVSRIFEVAARLNGLTAKAVEETAGN